MVFLAPTNNHSSITLLICYLNSTRIWEQSLYSGLFRIWQLHLYYFPPVNYISSIMMIYKGGRLTRWPSIYQRSQQWLLQDFGDGRKADAIIIWGHHGELQWPKGRLREAPLAVLPPLCSVSNSFSIASHAH